MNNVLVSAEMCLKTTPNNDLQ